MNSKENRGATRTRYCPSRRESLLAISEEIRGHLVYNDDSVFRRLGVNKVSISWARSCHAAFATEITVQAAKLELADIAADSNAQVGDTAEEYDYDLCCYLADAQDEMLHPIVSRSTWSIPHT